MVWVNDVTGVAAYHRQNRLSQQAYYTLKNKSIYITFI